MNTARMNTIADLRRRLTPGTVLTMTAHDWYPNGALIGQARTIVKVNTVGIGLDTVKPDGSRTVSHMEWPTRAGLRFDDTDPDTFAVMLDDDGTAWMHYRIG